MSRANLSIIDELTAVHGATFYDRDTGDTLDVVQAVCRQVWGPNWMHDAEFMAFDASDSIPSKYVIAAADMVKELPAWCQPKAQP